MLRERRNHLLLNSSCPYCDRHRICSDECACVVWSGVPRTAHACLLAPPHSSCGREVVAAADVLTLVGAQDTALEGRRLHNGKWLETTRLDVAYTLEEDLVLSRDCKHFYVFYFSVCRRVVMTNITSKERICAGLPLYYANCLQWNGRPSEKIERK